MVYILLVWGILGIPGYARLIRGNVLQEKNKTYVEAAKVAGATDSQIMFRHILPNAIAPAVIAVSFDIGGIILGLAGLSFLGLGDERLVEWGLDIALAREYFYMAPWTIFVPGIGIFITVLAFMLLGDGLRDALDPRLQGKK
jgi:ABC-type dipeptide/oligopeptide/nickel transport system permease subunit